MSENRNDDRPGDGGCQCGAVRYALSAPPATVYVCHCRDCRKQSASAFGISAIVDPEALKLRRGRPEKWSRPTAGGSVMDCYFCGTCGTRLWHIARDDPEAVSIKGGSLDTPPDLAAADHIWTSRKLSGVLIPPGCRQYPEEPDG